MKSNVKTLRAGVLVLSLTLLSNVTIKAEQPGQQEVSQASEENSRGFSFNALDHFLSPIISNAVGQATFAVKGPDQTRNLGTLTSDLGNARGAITAELTTISNEVLALGTTPLSTAANLANLGKPADVSGLYASLLALIVGHSIATPLSLIPGHSQAGLQVGQIGLVQIASRNPALTTLVVTSSASPAPADVAAYNTAIATALTNVAAAVTAVMLNVNTPTTPNYTAAVNALGTAVSALDVAIDDFNVVVGDNAVITSPSSTSAINNALNQLTLVVTYLQSLGLQS